jgi:hypothetical protein
MSIKSRHERKMKVTALLSTLLLAPSHAKKALRVFQTLPSEPTQMDQEQLMRSIRATQSMVFGGDGEAFLLALSKCHEMPIYALKLIYYTSIIVTNSKKTTPTSPSIWTSTPPPNDANISSNADRNVIPPTCEVSTG